MGASGTLVWNRVGWELSGGWSTFGMWQIWTWTPWKQHFDPKSV